VNHKVIGRIKRRTDLDILVSARCDISVNIQSAIAVVIVIHRNWRSRAELQRNDSLSKQLIRGRLDVVHHHRGRHK